MPQVWIPALLRDLAGGQQTVHMPGKTVRQVIENLEVQYPGIKARLCQGEKLRSSIIVTVDGEISLLGLRQGLQEASEVHLLPAISGGAT